MLSGSKTYEAFNSCIRLGLGVLVELLGLHLKSLQTLAVLHEVHKFVEAFLAIYILLDGFCNKCEFLDYAYSLHLFLRHHNHFGGLSIHLAPQPA